MGPKQAKFLERARAVHGDKYDYSMVEYTAAHSKVSIICPEHGKFIQSPNNHISSKSGCPVCAGNIKSTVENFILKAMEIHKGRYEYSLVEYRNCKTKVCVICPNHGVFNQTPDDHINAKAGCPQCAENLRGSKAKTPTEEFIRQSRIIHKDKFDYSLVEYKNTHTKVKIICPTHGIFEQVPMDHLKGNGCKLCSGKGVAYKQEDILTKIKQIHADKGTPNYDYSLVKYKNINTKIKIICKEHGEFYITPKSILLQHAGCRQCGLNISGFNKRNTLDDFITRSNIIHNNKYTYANSVYMRGDEKVSITCPIHGEFQQRPCNHIVGQGCPTCAREKAKGGKGGYTHEYFKNNPDQQDIPGILYAMNITKGKEHFIKIGITAKSVYHRYSRTEYRGMDIKLLYQEPMPIYEAFCAEQELLRELEDYKFFSNSKFSGYTELLQYKPVVIDRIREVFKI
ncbi:DUF723 domain-containing protein [Candidatus Dojkabacteria bacterium]|nr:DUF723 domain-containing protein [Candidatus Dojkabacteria bacterium]